PASECGRGGSVSRPTSPPRAATPQVAAAAAAAAAAPRLGAFVAEQRWSGARGERLARVHVDAVVPLDGETYDGDAACCIVSAIVGGDMVRYQLWLRTAWLASPDEDSPTDAIGD